MRFLNTFFNIYIDVSENKLTFIIYVCRDVYNLHVRCQIAHAGGGGHLVWMKRRGESMQGSHPRSPEGILHDQIMGVRDGAEVPHGADSTGKCAIFYRSD